MKIVADENIAQVQAFFADLGEVCCRPGREITRSDLAAADILLVRSVTQVDESLLAGTPVKFVGTCTIGTDHLDQDYLHNQGIEVASAPGCNAEAVVDYVISGVFEVAAKTDSTVTEQVLGIVGLGNVGSRLRDRAQALGMRTLCCDPPLAAAGEPGLIALPELLAQADIISLHTPLTKAGRHPTFHLLNRDNLVQLKQGALLINSARGGVVDNRALKALLLQRADFQVILDVWENEPAIDPELLRRVTLGTPHIAGYSLEGKLRGTAMVYQAACRFFQRQMKRTLEDYLPSPLNVMPDSAPPTEINQLQRWFRACYDITADGQALYHLCQQDEKQLSAGFDRLRKTYPLRREFGYLRLTGSDSSPWLQQQLAAIGIGQD